MQKVHGITLSDVVESNVLIEWLQNLSTVWNETEVKLDQAKQFTQFRSCSWLAKILNDFYLLF